jgi:D-alanyl-D-alanine carboxypeptidase
VSSNGRLTAAELAPIPGGQLSNEAARAWNAGPAKAGCRPLGPNSSYRDYAGQVYFWTLYQQGRGNLAARPGTSNHGWGKAVDLAAPYMRSWIDQHGRRFGWRKVEAPGEWWHVNYVGGYRPPPNPLRVLGPKQRKAANQLLYHRRMARREAASGKGPRYRRHVKWRKHWRGKVQQLHREAHGKRRRVLAQVLQDRDGSA